MALKLVKNKIKSTQRTSKVTRAMEAVSAVKMRKSQERAIMTRPYAESALRILERVSHTLDAQRHPLFVSHPNARKRCVIVVTSDKGLAGSLNSAVLREAARFLEGVPVESVDLICFGKKSYEYFTRRGYAVIEHYLNVSDDVQISDMEHVVKTIVRNFSNDMYTSVHVIYQSFVTTFEQKPIFHQLLPLERDSLHAIVDGIIPKRGKYSELKHQEFRVAYTVEPTLHAVYEAIFPMLIKVMMYHALLESKASEHSARMVAMKNATDKAKEVTRQLTLEYNKERQSIITAEVSEITGGIEAMKTQ